MSEYIHTADEASVRVITIARPDKKNALTQAMYASIIDALEQGDADPGVRVFVIAAQGSIFTSGNDLADFASSSARADGAPSAAERFPYALTKTRKPIIVAVNGPAVGVGVTMLLQCDLVYAADSATFRAPFVDLALVPEGASSLLMPAALGRARANTLLLLGDTWTATDAFAAGLISGVVPASDLMPAVMARARALASKAPGAVRTSKALINADVQAILDRIRHANAVFADRIASPEFAEAASAFMTRRPADFSKFS
ncbi:MAG: enoyl-CoA hydratase-related protein [Alphaproteobacteria bacterium]|jgi:enoyl-CoA hydratase/carnithine racemase